MKWWLLPGLVTCFLSLCACTPSPSSAPDKLAKSTPNSSPSPAAVASYIDPQHRFAIAIPADMTLQHDFKQGYFGNVAWKAFADPDSHGTPAVALILDGSNTITSAALRIGTSTDDKAVAHCLDVPGSGVPADVDSVTLAGSPFLHFHASDAAMSHYLDMDGYRAVHAGRCYAIDLIISGTRPEVFSPPATPPFQTVAARQKLHDALQGFRLQD